MYSKINDIYIKIIGIRMTELSREIKKKSGVKKNISIFKKDKTIKIKSTPIQKKNQWMKQWNQMKYYYGD